MSPPIVVVRHAENRQANSLCPRIDASVAREAIARDYERIIGFRVLNDAKEIAYDREAYRITRHVEVLTLDEQSLNIALILDSHVNLVLDLALALELEVVNHRS